MFSTWAGPNCKKFIHEAKMDNVAAEPGRKEKSVHIAVGFFFFANYLIITMFLGLPFTFFHGGILTGMLTVTAVGVLSRITANWELESIARAQVGALQLPTYYNTA